jgi:hypothetical protein
MSGEDTRQGRVLLHLPSLAKATARVFISFQLRHKSNQLSHKVRNK